jgi:hypothetical protein
MLAVRGVMMDFSAGDCRGALSNGVPSVRWAGRRIRLLHGGAA